MPASPPWAGGGDGFSGPARPKGGNARTGPLPLHPMSFGDIIDGVFRLLRANARTLAPLLLALAVPFEVLSAYATRNSAGLSQVLSNLSDLQDRQLSLSTTDLVLSLLAELGILIMTPIVAGAVCRTVAISYIGQQPGTRQVAKLGARRLVALVVASLLVHLLEGLAALLCLLPALVVMALFVLTAPAIVLEGLGPVAGMRRSWRLVKRRFWPVLGTAVLGGLMASLAVSLVGLLPDALAALASPHVRAVMDAIVGTFTEAFEWALVTMLATLLYFDQRIRQEGLDLEVTAARAR
ncbi:MAG: hypothetical protein ACLQVK_24950 [Acidimicrobiales bacterium]